MANIVSHGACGVKWTQVANQTGHCSGCHLTFSSGDGFDRHQSIVDGRNKCKHPTECKPPLVARLDRNTGTEIWGRPSTTGEAWYSPEGLPEPENRGGSDE
jgi:hypothetical protein